MTRAIVEIIKNAEAIIGAKAIPTHSFGPTPEQDNKPDDADMWYEEPCYCNLLSCPECFLRRTARDTQ